MRLLQPPRNLDKDLVQDLNRQPFQENLQSSTRKGIFTIYFLVMIRSATTAKAMAVVTILTRPMANWRVGLPSNRGLPAGGGAM